MNSSERIEELDSLRGILSLGVVAFHLYIQQLFWLWSCVDGFFVLSGFVISRLLLATNLSAGNLFNFYARRTLRIWPVYFLTLLVTLALNWVYVARNDLSFSSILGIPQSFVFLQFIQFYWQAALDFIPYEYIHWFGHSWSLAAEEQFYWLWPLVILACRKRPLALVAASVALLAISVAMRASGHLVLLLGTRADGLALGSLLAVTEYVYRVRSALIIANRRRIVLAGFAVSLACAGVLAEIYVVPDYRMDVAPSLYYVNTTWLVTLFALMMAAIVGSLWLYRGSSALAVMRSKPLVWLGNRSYAIYMFHPAALGMVDRFGARFAWSRTEVCVITVAAVILLSHLSYVFMESRLARYRHRFPLMA